MTNEEEIKNPGVCPVKGKWYGVYSHIKTTNHFPSPFWALITPSYLISTKEALAPSWPNVVF
jgi:hypothetical protein